MRLFLKRLTWYRLNKSEQSSVLGWHLIHKEHDQAILLFLIGGDVIYEGI